MATIFFHLSISSLQLVFLVLLFGWCTHLEFLQPASCLTDVKTTRGCIDIEREALLKFKSDLTDPSNRLSSWHAWDDCCVWEGVGCNNSTGHVVKLNLRNPVDPDDDWDRYKNTELGGKVNPSLVHLKHLNYLDLSMNHFNTSNIPAFIGSLSELKYLNLSWSSFHGNIPPHLGNLSKLQYLDLKANDLKVDYSLEFLSGLSSLKYLSLRSVNLSKVSGDWLEHVNMLPSLIELRLPGCSLQQIPRWLFNLTSLKTLGLSSSGIHGPIPDSFANMTSLQNMCMSYNELEGRIPRSMGTLCNLRNLDPSNNNLNGPIIEQLVSSFNNGPNKKRKKKRVGPLRRIYS